MRTCPACKFGGVRDGDKYCRSCGHAVFSNKCSNKDCVLNKTTPHVPLPDDDSYCYECGEETMAYLEGLTR